MSDPNGAGTNVCWSTQLPKFGDGSGASQPIAFDGRVYFCVSQKDATPGRGLVIAVSDTEYYIVAANCTVKWGAKPNDRRVPEFVSVDEGEFVKGRWRPDRRLNGDEATGEYLRFGPVLELRRVVLHSFR